MFVICILKFIKSKSILFHTTMSFSRKTSLCVYWIAVKLQTENRRRFWMQSRCFPESLESWMLCRALCVHKMSVVCKRKQNWHFLMLGVYALVEHFRALNFLERKHYENFMSFPTKKLVFLGKHLFFAEKFCSDAICEFNAALCF